MVSLKNLIVLIFFSVSKQQECAVKKTSCAELKTAEGFNFSHGFFGGSTVTAVRHQIPIAHGVLSPPSFNFTPDVRSMDISSIVTVACEDLRIEVTCYNGRYVSERCVDFKVIDEVKPPVGVGAPHLGYIKCAVKNVSCSEIKTAEGFKFSHGISSGSTVTAICNQIPIAHGLLSPRSFNFTPDVKSMDSSSIVTAACHDIRIEVTHNNGRHVRESCVDFKVNDEVKPPVGEATPYLGYIIGGSAVGAVVGAVVLIACLCYIPWRRKEKKKNGVAEFPENMSVEEGDDGDLASQQDGSSIDPEAGGGTARMLCLNHNFSNGGIQPSTNGCISHSVVASGSNDQTANQNVKDDPGGMNDNEGKCRKMYSGRTRGGQSPEGHENEDEPLLLKPSCQEELHEPPPPPPHRRFEGPAIQVSDMTGGEAVVWWTRRGSDPAPTGRCSAAPDVDVDSAPNMKQN